ncbi:hypothetical protein E2C01_069082 [Portunus trituberculatus]|uniref:Uncharacterized protein n=1 Tax=Portunus trituberculatus TaxID=210409 RepID=A0A5B7I182_PORTR|nr:hypothetical protein [Portunus trituberculatus]
MLPSHAFISTVPDTPLTFLSLLAARTGDNNSMGRNLRAARWLDFTDKDDDDGLYQPCSDSDSEATKKKE